MLTAIPSLPDCSISDETVPGELRGKYGAFAVRGSAGMAHLQSLQAAGLTHIHLLPCYDIGSIPERVQDQATVQVCSCVMKPSSSESAACHKMSDVTSTSLYMQRTVSMLLLQSQLANLSADA